MHKKKKKFNCRRVVPDTFTFGAELSNVGTIVDIRGLLQTGMVFKGYVGAIFTRGNPTSSIDGASDTVSTGACTYVLATSDDAAGVSHYLNVCIVGVRLSTTLQLFLYSSVQAVRFILARCRSTDSAQSLNCSWFNVLYRLFA